MINNSLTTEEKKARFLEYYSQLPIQKLACGFAGVSEDTAIRWKKDDTDFANQVEEAKSAWALKTSSEVKSKEWLLERTMKDHFAEKKEIEVKTPTPIIPEVIPDVSSDNSTTQNNSTD